MDVEIAKEVLNTCERRELRDHAFGDSEVFWVLDGKKIADGYFGKSSAYVTINSDPSVKFENEEARQLQECGTLAKIDRNDTTGPEEYAEGVVMPGLTKEGVLDELTKTDNPTNEEHQR